MKKEIVKISCPQCVGVRDCTQLFQKKISWSGEYGDGWDTYNVLQCCGCSTVFFVHTEYSSEDSDEDSSPINTIYPAQEINYTNKLLTFFDFSDDAFEISALAREINKAINLELYRIAAMGIRTWVLILANKVMGEKFDTFDGCVTALVANGHISKTQRDLLDQALELGHSAVHRNHRPDKRQTLAALDIVIAIFQVLIRSEEKAAILRKVIPPRTPKKRSPN